MKAILCWLFGHNHNLYGVQFTRSHRRALVNLVCTRCRHLLTQDREIL